jgi:hypothetical protein
MLWLRSCARPSGWLGGEVLRRVHDQETSTRGVTRHATSFFFFFFLVLFIDRNMHRARFVEINKSLRTAGSNID